MITIDYRNPQPVYEQLINQIKQLIFLGVLPPDGQLPSVRQLSKELAVNPNTVQKAYVELERMGLTYSIPGRGSFVAPDSGQVKDLHRREQLEQLQQAILSAKESGIGKEELLQLISQLF